MENKESIEKAWKELLDQEDKEAQTKNKTEHKPTFSIFLSSLSIQAMIAMGRLKNPLTEKMESNPEQARFLIGTLEIIKEKTKNNLDDKEKNLIENFLIDLKILYLKEKKLL